MKNADAENLKRLCYIFSGQGNITVTESSQCCTLVAKSKQQQKRTAGDTRRQAGAAAQPGAALREKRSDMEALSQLRAGDAAAAEQAPLLRLRCLSRQLGEAARGRPRRLVQPQRI